MRRILLLVAAIISIGSISATAQVALSGNIYYDSTSNTDTFKVWLIVKQGNILSAADSQIVTGFAGNAQYSFTGVTQGLYRVKAHHLNPNSFVSSMVPTYHDSVLLWSNAATITIGGQNSTMNDIYMKTGVRTNGPGFVGGNVQQGANKGTANGIEGLDIFLFDANSNVVAYAVTDANGDYTFNNIANGTYTVHPEQMNYATTTSSVTVDATNPSHTAVNFERSLSAKTIVPKASSVTNVNSNEVSFTMYPNPANNRVVLNWAKQSNNAASVTITDISGKKVYSTETKMQGQSVIEFGDLQTGFYMLNVSSDLGNSTHKLFIQH